MDCFDELFHSGAVADGARDCENRGAGLRQVVVRVAKFFLAVRAEGQVSARRQTRGPARSPDLASRR